MKIDTHQFIARSSDKRDTFQIKDTEFGLDFIKSLRPVDYILDVRNDYITQAPEYPAEPASENDILEYNKKYNEWVESRSLTPIVPNGENKRSRFHHGLIAQEVKEVLEEKGIDFGGFQDRKIKGGEDVLGIVYEELIAPLIKAVQEQQKQIEELSAEVAALKSK